MQQYVLGIDIGTGSTKSVAIGFKGNSLGIAQHYYPVNNPKPGYAEQDPQLILEAFISCIVDITRKLGPPAAVSFSSAMHSVIPVDENGKALNDMIIWADARSQSVAERIRASADGLLIYRTCGTPIHAMTPLCKLIWLQENEPDLFHRTSKFISIKEYIWYHLFGVYQVDHSIASATGLFDITTLQWNTRACRLAGISSGNLSEPVSTTFYRTGLNAGLAAMLKLNEHTPFVIGSSDGCCANLGSFINKPDIASVTIGTSGAVRITSPKPVIDEGAMIFNYLLAEKTFVCGGAVNNGGSAVQWLIKTFLNIARPGHKEYDELFAQAATAPAGSEGLIFLPYLNGERAPIWDTHAGGVYFNMRQHHNQAHFLRAGLEGICYALYDVLQTLEQSSAPIRQIHISGGFINSPLWTQLLADITGKQLVIIQQEDASALGAIFLAARALALPNTIMQPPAGERIVIKPDTARHESYQKTFKLYKKLYTHLKELMREVSG